jgi:hypothetical protein
MGISCPGWWPELRKCDLRSGLLADGEDRRGVDGPAGGLGEGRHAQANGGALAGGELVHLDELGGRGGEADFESLDPEPARRNWPTTRACPAGSPPSTNRRLAGLPRKSLLALPHRGSPDRRGARRPGGIEKTRLAVEAAHGVATTPSERNIKRLRIAGSPAVARLMGREGMHVLTGQRIQVRGQNRGQRLTPRHPSSPRQHLHALRRRQ